MVKRTEKTSNFEEVKMEIEEWLKREGEKFFKKIKIKEKDVILDFGCGEGRYTDGYILNFKKTTEET